MAYAWTLAGNDEYVHVKHIGTGPIGEVHEVPLVLCLLTLIACNSRNVSGIPHFGHTNRVQLIARKIVSQPTHVSEEDIESEFRVIETFYQHERHPNIIEVLAYGRLYADHPLCYLDMPLYTNNLATYITTFSSAGYSLEVKARNATYIIREIAKGLSFMHNCGVIHRDVKPQNGTCISRAAKDQVLYNTQNGRGNPYDPWTCTWVIADISLTLEGLSSRIQGLPGRGNPSYRAPEVLLQESPGYNTKSDIWAMGCILAEMITGQKLFGDDAAVIALVQAGMQTPALVSWFVNQDSYLLQSVGGILGQLVAVLHRARAAASGIVAMCDRLLGQNI